MDRRLAVLLGAIGLTMMGTIPHAGAAPLRPAESYADQLAPAANPLATLAVDDASHVSTPGVSAPVELVQYYSHDRHHRRYAPRRRRHYHR